jgi:uncharacterized membrane protein/mono/diheme cytochrome c family protein
LSRQARFANSVGDIDATIANMIEFFGKFHPLLVHLPIGFLLLLGALEWLVLRPGWKELATANRVILLLTIPASLASVACGWLLAVDGGYDATALFWHRWLGTGVAVAVIALWVIRQRGWMTAYRRSLFATLVLLTVASHFGGSITHGSDYLAWPKTRSPEAGPLTEEQLLAQAAYATVIHPIFDKYCFSCHGADKSKGGLRMDTAAHLIKGGDSGSPLDPPGAEASLLGNRLNLPEDDDDHMPPAGKPQLSAAQLAVIKWWLDAGAKTDATTLSALKPTPEILREIQSALLTPSSARAEAR